jgi:hypothetical protein
MSQPFNLDARSVLVDKLGENSERFQVSNLFFKNAKGLTALYEIRKLKSELLDFAKDPTLGDDQLGPVKPKQPKLENLTEEEAQQEIQNYRELMKQYEIAQQALKMQVPIPDMFAIMQYMEPFEDTIHATPAVKGRRFHAFTKQIEEEQKGLFGMSKKAVQ